MKISNNCTYSSKNSLVKELVITEYFDYKTIIKASEAIEDNTFNDNFKSVIF